MAGDRLVAGVHGEVQLIGIGGGVFMQYVTASANRHLDEILDLIGINLQLNQTQFERAETSYHAVGEWLQDDRSPVAVFDPKIFPQGSLLLDTTVKPLSHTEFDLDLVCLLFLSGVKPMEVYDLLLERMRSHGRYAPIVFPERRCIRIKYADFHLDIVPAIPDPDCPPGETCLLIPDSHKKVWRPSNPKGFAAWFNGRTRIRGAVFYERKEIEPLKAPAPAYMKPPLKIAVQLLKRWRDVAFKGRMDLAPSSIILTTLAGHLYRGEDHPTDALTTILDGIYMRANAGPIRLQNPSNTKESITDRWNDKPAMYDAFITEVFGFRVRWHELVKGGRYPNFVDELKALFDEAPVIRAVTKFAERRREASQSGNLIMEKATGILSVNSVPAVAAGYVQGKGHTFYGE
jgi:hypothetical protein